MGHACEALTQCIAERDTVLALESLEVACTARVSTSILSVSGGRERTLSMGVLVLGCRALPLEERLSAFLPPFWIAG